MSGIISLLQFPSLDRSPRYVSLESHLITNKVKYWLFMFMVIHILCGYMVQELLCNHLVAPIFGSPRAMFCRNLFEFCILRKWSHLEVLQKHAWLLPLGHWVAADSTGPKARRKHKSDAVEHVVVSCRCCGGCCGRCRCSSRCSCAWYG